MATFSSKEILKEILTLIIQFLKRCDIHLKSLQFTWKSILLAFLDYDSAVLFFPPFLLFFSFIHLTEKVQGRGAGEAGGSGRSRGELEKPASR